MDEVQRSPIDYDALQKGDRIPALRIEEILGVSRHDQIYAFKLMALMQRVEAEFLLRGKIWTLTTEKGDLVILTDAEASGHNSNRAAFHRRGEYKRFVLNSAVDPSTLSPDEKKQHERRLYIQGRFIQAQAQVQSELKLEAHKRNVPGIPQRGPMVPPKELD